jgi:hypothetical protein
MDDGDQMPALNPKLELFTTQELMEALLLRYDDAVFAGMIDRKSNDPADAHRIISRRFVGDLVGCMGLLTLLQLNCANQLHEQITELSPDDL